MNRKVMLISSLMAGLMVAASCASMSALQTARTLPMGEVTVVGAGAITGVHIESDDPAIDDVDAMLPVVETMARLGIWDGVDVGLKYFIGGVLADAKYQFYGLEAESKSALAAGFGVNYSSSDIGWWDLYFPLYASFDPSTWSSVYASPRYVLRAAGDLGTHHLVGAVGGVSLGSKRKVFLEGGYMIDTGLGLLEGPTFQATLGVTVDSKKLFGEETP